MELAEEQRDREEREMMDRKRAQLREAERQRDEPVDDSKLVEQMFDFLPDSASEAQAPPAAFKVRSWCPFGSSLRRWAGMSIRSLSFLWNPFISI